MKSSIIGKLRKSYLTLTMLLALIIILGLIAVTFFTTLPNIRLTLQSTTDGLRNRINEQIAYLERAADTALLDLNDLDYALLAGTQGNELTRYNTINQSLYLLKTVYFDAQMVFFVDMSGKIFADNCLLEEKLQAALDPQMNQTLFDSHGQTYSFGICELPGVTGGPVLLVGKMIRYINNGTPVGYFYVAGNSGLLEALYEEQMLCEGQRIFVCDDSGTVLSSSQPDVEDPDIRFDRPGELFAFSGGRLWVYEQEYLEKLHASTVIMLPLMELYQTSAMIILVIFAAFIAGTLLSLQFTAAMTKRIFTPLVRLTEDANAVSSGNLKIRFTGENTDDEIAVLAQSFNRMLDHIEELVQRVRQEEEEKLRSELSAQQNKIQPHFLYNTLNTISALSQLGRSEEAAHTAQLLAKYYRVALSDGKDIISISQELKYVEFYLQIMLVSRASSLEYTVQCSEEAANAAIPKMTLQPLVENAVKYAFAPGERSRIAISAACADGRVSVCIADNGAGIDVQRFNDIISGKIQGHYGLISVCNRMKVLCGDEYRIEAVSAPGEGTKIILTYPVLEIP